MIMLFQQLNLATHESVAGIDRQAHEEEIHQWKTNLESLAHSHRLLEVQLQRQKEKYLRDVVAVQVPLVMNCSIFEFPYLLFIV